jgi:hypothetical protein
MGFTNLAKKLDRVIKSKKVTEAARGLVSNKKESPEFQRAYNAMELAYDRFRPLGLHFTLLRNDGKMVFSSENTVDQIKAMTDNYATRPEVGHAMRSFIGYDFKQYEIDNKINFKSGIKSLLQTGCGVAKRYGFTSGDLEIYVAKAVLGDGRRPSGYESIYRVSQKVDVE